MLFIINPISGQGKKERIASYIKDMGHKILYTEYPGHGEHLARETTEDVVVAVGGDGTVNEVARGLIGSNKTLGIIPCGSGDGLALHLGISRDLHKAMEIIERGNTKPLDAATINGRLFFSVCGTGLDAIVSEQFALSRRRGLINYIWQTLKIWMTFKPDMYRIDVDGKVINTEAAFITVGNSNQWGNNARITPLADTSDGELDVVIVKMLRTLDVPIFLWQLMSGTIYRSRNTLCLRGHNVNITRRTAGPAHLDGEWFSAPVNLEIKVRPNSLRVIVP